MNTAARRSSPVPQLKCVGGSASGRYEPKTVQCYNRGSDGVDVQWECKADMSTDFQFGRIMVNCEGYDYPEDPYILRGSCGLEYELELTETGRRNQAAGGDSYQYKKTPSAPPLYDTGKKPTDHHGGMPNFMTLIIICIIIYVLYKTCIQRNHGQQPGVGDAGIDGRGGPGGGGGGGGGGGFFDGGPGGFFGRGGGGAPAPGFKPPPTYDEATMGFGRSRPHTATGGGAGPSGAGFWTGAGLGALGGYLFGRRGQGATHTAGRTYGMPTQFERDTGFYDRPSTSQPPTYPTGGSSSSSTTHTSSGFGGTRRR